MFIKSEAPAILGSLFFNIQTMPPFKVLTCNLKALLFSCKMFLPLKYSKECIIQEIYIGWRKNLLTLDCFNVSEKIKLLNQAFGFLFTSKLFLDLFC